jgi:threonine/homoserine/homoserine lactone efflux protein
MTITQILSFAGASILLTLMPGPDIIYVLTESLTKGLRTGVSVAVGLVTGVLIHTTLAATGLSLIIQQSEIVFSVIKYLGAGYLFFLAWSASREKQITLDQGEGKVIDDRTFFQLFRKGFFMNILNPKVALFFIAFLPQFIVYEGISPMWQMIILGWVFIFQALLIFVIVSILAGRFAGFFNRSKFQTIAKWGKVAVLVLLGLSLIVAGH